MKLIQSIKFDDEKFFTKECEVVFWRRKNLDEEINIIKEKLKKEGVKVVAIHLSNYHINKEGKEGKEELENLKRDIKKLLFFNPEIINMHCLYGNPEIMIKNLITLHEDLEAFGMFFTIENMSKRKANIFDANSAKSFFSSLPERFGLCFDISHVPVIDEKNHTSYIIDFIDSVSERIKHIHLSDVRKINGKYVKHQPIGTGIIDMERIKERISKLNVYVTIEYMPEYKEEIGESIELFEIL